MDSLTADGTSLTNVVTATSPTATAPVSDTATITVRQANGGEADLTISKSGPDTAMAGEQITYTLVVTNRGPATANDVQAVDALPDGVRFVRATSSQGICESGVSCQLGNMALDATSTITVVGVVASDVATGTTLVNLARVDAANPDTNPSNNASSASMMVTAEALMSIVKEVAPSQAKPGATVTYRIVVTNSGPKHGGECGGGGQRTCTTAECSGQQQCGRL
ncbi:MAG: DUF11 domain-containing protein [Anaerolineales bacterium]|nr:DUF11 domain-containing protein [Anaerolineales bacterium]